MALTVYVGVFFARGWAEGKSMENKKASARGRMLSIKKDEVKSLI
jgi:hypothetical protein